jgi:hypothetical protein
MTVNIVVPTSGRRLRSLGVGKTGLAGVLWGMVEAAGKGLKAQCLRCPNP